MNRDETATLGKIMNWTVTPDPDAAEREHCARLAEADGGCACGCDSVPRGVYVSRLLTERADAAKNGLKNGR